MLPYDKCMSSLLKPLTQRRLFLPSEVLIPPLSQDVMGGPPAGSNYMLAFVALCIV